MGQGELGLLSIVLYLCLRMLQLYCGYWIQYEISYLAGTVADPTLVQRDGQNASFGIS